MNMRSNRNKYKVSAPDRRTWNGRTYASRAEMLYAQQLGLMLKAGEIIQIDPQPTLRLGCYENVYRPDFKVYPKSGDPYHVDVKGVETPKFKRDKRLFKRYGVGELHIVKRRGQTFATVEVIRGEGEKS